MPLSVMITRSPIITTFGAPDQATQLQQLQTSSLVAFSTARTSSRAWYMIPTFKVATLSKMLCNNKTAFAIVDAAHCFPTHLT